MSYDTSDPSEKAILAVNQNGTAQIFSIEDKQTNMFSFDGKDRRKTVGGKTYELRGNKNLSKYQRDQRGPQKPL